ncbi:MAG TPA: DUF6600 domain-containing protein [Bacteroidota bacterium]|jgi:hypothetical protein|nr:DUF6600 domain-containing protein [Bacteroidota bacterium]
MKALLKIFAVVVVLIAGIWIPPQKLFAQEATVSFQLFYDQLSPYGMWVDYENYGYVWIPDVDQDFSPYGTDGHWVFTVDGWTWVSDYSWGWAPFHYGRWAYDDSYGWLWVPNNEWGPAWVTWRRSPGYYGWAPMRPGISVELSFGGGYRVPNERWTFVSDRYISSPQINRYYVDRSTNVSIINNSTVISNTYVDNSRHTTYVAGPAKDDVQKATGAAITPLTIRENNKPGQALSNDQLRIYRPQVQAGTANERKPAPAKLVSLKDVKPVSERKQGNQRRSETPPANGVEQLSQPQNAKRPDERSKDQQPPMINPSDMNKRKGQTPRPEPARPSDERKMGQQPPMMSPPDMNKGKERSSQPEQARRPDERKMGQQPPMMSPPDMNKGIEKTPQRREAASEIKGKDKQPRRTPTPNKKGKTQPKPNPDKKDEQKPVQ